jgi:hypothetical protein
VKPSSLRMTSAGTAERALEPDPLADVIRIAKQRRSPDRNDNRLVANAAVISPPLAHGSRLRDRTQKRRPGARLRQGHDHERGVS